MSVDAPRRRVLRWGLVGVVALALVAGLGWTLRPTPSLVVAGQEVGRAELDFQLRRLEPVVADEARRTGRAADRLLAERTVAVTGADHTVLRVAREQGVLAETDFASLMALREQTNADRAEAVRDGEVVYGLTEFGDDEFYDHLLAAVRTEVGQRLSDEPGDPLHATDADVEAYFASHADRWRTNATRYHVVALTVPAAEAKTPGCRELLTGDVAATDLVDPTGCPTGTIEQPTLDGSEPAPRNSPRAQLLQGASTLDVGAVTPATSSPDHVRRVGLLDAETDSAAALDQYRPRIRQALLDEQLTSYLDERRAGLDVDADLDRLTALAQETLS